MESHITTYQSTDVYLNTIESLQIVKEGILGESPSSQSQGDRDGFLDTESFNEAIDKARTGDSEIASKIMPKMLDIPASNRLDLSWDVSGNELDPARDLAGIPECFSSYSESGPPTVSILVNLSCPHTIKRETIINRGKAILELMSGLEASGYSVDISVCLSAKTNRTKHRQLEVYTTVIKVKDSTEYFNLHKLAFWLVSPSVLRRFSFKERESMPKRLQSHFGHGYGYSVEMPDIPNDVIYFPTIQDNDESSYRAKVKTAIEKYCLIN